jgi:hypothetical protein
MYQYSGVAREVIIGERKKPAEVINAYATAERPNP